MLTLKRLGSTYSIKPFSIYSLHWLLHFLYSSRRKEQDWTLLLHPGLFATVLLEFALRNRLASTAQRPPWPEARWPWLVSLCLCPFYQVYLKNSFFKISLQVLFSVSQQNCPPVSSLPHGGSFRCWNTCLIIMWCLIWLYILNCNADLSWTRAWTYSFYPWDLELRVRFIRMGKKMK